ncbi:4-hydroxy-tetrahydrodipicolinate reductase [Aminipila butyrica]|uniref:4-hydroxy-tetrahydrodipicolinate reductase n=1 Tax=Aminipila butyrica TaxID=433296 RepID=A0A858BYA7_9FIRM|nr:4-hydroxy-tetrahydrodipicolinate reductase [Aminipila butyrica]QIB69890.1 4-hydroxy-tetrahydrodipicolinate reductase [Aminipila butyrica]
MDIILHGAKGQMGVSLEALISESSDLHIAAGIDPLIDGGEAYPGFSQLADCPIPAQVILDFSNHAALSGLLTYALQRQIPLVLATTAFTDAEYQMVLEAAKQLPIFHAANLSVGIQSVVKALQALVPLLEPDFHMEIVEKHHSRKADSPSGTALRLADTINDCCTQKKEYIYGRHGTDTQGNIRQLGIHAIRGGTIAGEHILIFAGPDELIELKHTALSRRIFASGALRAARFIVEQNPGLFSMADLI